MTERYRPRYDFNDPIFRSKRNWMTYAKEHQELWDVQYNSDVIDYKVLSTVGHLRIPSTYLVTYRLRSISSIAEDLSPVYGDRHELEVTLPTRYPLEPARIFMQTDMWHPNIQSKGRWKGKICGNVDGFGVDYTLRQLILRIGEMLQFRNYLAEFRPPYPEDPEAARWVKEVAEPKEYVDRAKGIYTDYQPLMRPERRDPPTRPGGSDPVPEGPRAPIKIKKRTPPPPTPRRKLKL